MAAALTMAGAAVWTGCSDGAGEVSAARVEPSGDIVEVDAPRTLVASSGARLVVSGVRLPFGRTDAAPAEPFAPEGQAGLRALVLGRTIAAPPQQGGAARDRLGRFAGPIWLEGEGEPLQALLVRAGLARVAPDAFTRDEADVWLGLEAEARADGVGLWAGTDYRIWQADDLAQLQRGALGRRLGEYVLAQGVLVQTSAFGRRVFLNFGAAYQTDFTALIEGPSRALFDLDALGARTGAQIRVRGHLERWNGPLVRLYERAQIEWL